MSSATPLPSAVLRYIAVHHYNLGSRNGATLPDFSGHDRPRLNPARAVRIRAFPAAERRHVVAAGAMVHKAD
jgi:hypothetical protein